MKIGETKALRLYGPYREGATGWIIHPPKGKIVHCNEPIHVALWLEKHYGTDRHGVCQTGTCRSQSEARP